jgi:transposase
MKRPRRNHSAAFKAKVALAAVQGDATLAERSQRFDVHASQVTQWQQHLLANAVAMFGEREDRQQTGEIERLAAKIGELTRERDFLQRAVGKLPGLNGKR